MLRKRVLLVRRKGFLHASRGLLWEAGMLSGGCVCESHGFLRPGGFTSVLTPCDCGWDGDDHGAAESWSAVVLLVADIPESLLTPSA